MAAIGSRCLVWSNPDTLQKARLADPVVSLVAKNIRSHKVPPIRGSSSREFKGVEGSSNPDPSRDVVCPECSGTFTGNRGMNVHCRSAHPEYYHSERTVEIGAAISAQQKRRLDTEEEAIMVTRTPGCGKEVCGVSRSVPSWRYYYHIVRKRP